MWQLSFFVQPKGLEDVRHNLKVDERVLRFMFSKRRALDALPNTYTVTQRARRLLGAGAHAAD